MPFVDLCQVDHTVSDILDNATIRIQKTSYFLQVDPNSGFLRFKTRKECNILGLLSRIFKVYKDVSYESYLLQLVFNECSVFDLNNSDLRQMYLRDIPSIQSLNPTRFKRFLQILIPGCTKNLWYRLLHNKIS
ncbi:uncharacterized protein B0P05DRAFT_589051 [Gilbertella persicaria]|uniref:uncharacterized protein n=1 Tax=Gilbertella persicaria TaxID=101096 RepID=UPI002220B5C2|nr:uncharacterized protein B0P05DRAFT_589051 [Gilbertella persicaria]KAI8071192.1 hypothetical protein B0P05DRAFT_589051 [Gilbertella persicaria]